jgi:hypothetical protein
MYIHMNTNVYTGAYAMQIGLDMTAHSISCVYTYKY